MPFHKNIEHLYAWISLNPKTGEEEGIIGGMLESQAIIALVSSNLHLMYKMEAMATQAAKQKGNRALLVEFDRVKVLRSSSIFLRARD